MLAPAPGSGLRAPASAAPTRKKGPSPWPPIAAIAGAAAPGVWLLTRALLGKLGADPVAEVLNSFGLYALSCLLASLACTPLQRISGWNWILRARKPLGLAAFFWALAHLSFYAGVDQGLAFGEIVKDVIKRPFITLGMGTFLLLLPLALTSTQRAQKWMGFRRWKRLHRLAYVAGGLACIHYYLRFKLPEAWPIAAAVLVSLLLLLRIGWRRWLGSRTS